MSKCALIAEDDEDVRRLIEIVLLRHCSTIDSAADGARAIEMLRERRYDLVVLDIMLPKINGLEVAKFIREQPSPPATVVVSGIARYVDERLPEGTVTLQKPLDLDEFDAQVASLLSNGGRA